MNNRRSVCKGQGETREGKNLTRGKKGSGVVKRLGGGNKKNFRGGEEDLFSSRQGPARVEKENLTERLNKEEEKKKRRAIELRTRKKRAQKG